MTEEQRRRAYELISQPDPEEALDDGAAGEDIPAPIDEKLERRLVETALRARGQRVAEVVPLRPRRTRSFLWGLGGLAAAAAVLVVVLMKQTETLPQYAMTLQQQAATLAAGEPPPATGTVTRLRRHGPLSVAIAPPSGAASAAAETRSYIRRGDRIARWEGVELERADDGSYHLQGPIWQMPQLEAGECELIFVIAPPGKLPDDGEIADAVRAGAPKPGAKWQLFSRRVLLVDE